MYQEQEDVIASDLGIPLLGCILRNNSDCCQKYKVVHSNITTIVGISASVTIWCIQNTPAYYLCVLPNIKFYKMEIVIDFKF